MLFTSYYSGGVADTSFVPTDIDSCKLWLKADAGITKDGSNYVSKWEDQSGNGFDVAQSTGSYQPLWVANDKNGNPGIYFANTKFLKKDSLCNIYSSGDSITTFIAWHCSTTPSSSYGYSLYSLYWNGAYTEIFAALVKKTSPSLTTLIRSNTNYLLLSKLFSYANDSLYIYQQIVDFSLATLDVKTYINNKYFEASTLAGTNIPYVNSLYIGYHWNGIINEVIVFTKLLTASENNKVYNYLHNKYGY